MNYFESISESVLSELELCFERTEGMVTFDEAVLLYQLAKQACEGCIVEVGSYRGRSTTFLGRGSIDGTNSQVYAIDPHKSFVGVLGGIFGPKDRTAFYRAMLDNNCSEIVSLINLSSEVIAARWVEPVSLLWVDGDHAYAGVKRDFECWQPHLKKNAIIAFDDAVDANLGPFKLIDELVASNKYRKTLSIGKVVVIQSCENKL